MAFFWGWCSPLAFFWGWVVLAVGLLLGWAGVAEVTALGVLGSGFWLRLARGIDTRFAWLGSWVGAGCTREDTGGEDQLGVGFKIDGEGGRILVTPCHGGGRGPGDVERRGAGEVQRGFWGCSGVCLCDGVAGLGGSGVKWVCAVTAN